tara:strand:+ start:4650 stop:5240 length:591 start_codon:yes stop_codon:yes gene_type:complete
LSGKGHGGTPFVPMTLACLLATAAMGWMAISVVPPNKGEAPLALRLILNPMCRAILGLAIAACIYALLELRGSLMDVGGRLGILSWSSGRTEAAITGEHWRVHQEQRLAPLSYAVFALPLLGFIGTVIGISGAIGDLGAMFEAEDRGQALAAVLGELRFAFDTTFAGLAGVLPVALGLLIIRNVNAQLGAQMADVP